ncbi:MAG: ATP-binding protein, partial [Actinomycetota bacterium]|nr:ATP-binding protein [Actinomycetota bacterium]
SHPNPERIGEAVSTDPSVPLSGEVYVGTQTGTLGTSWRVKVPIFADGEVLGSVSVGILESELNEEFLANLGWLVLAMIASAILGVFGAAWVTAVIRKRIYRLEPREIAALMEGRETMLHRLSEGIVMVDKAGNITLVNDAAEKLLGRSADDLVGRRAEDTLPDTLLQVLEAGEPDGRLVLSGERVLVARSTGRMLNGEPVEAQLLLRDHTELHELLRQMDGAQSLAVGLRAQAHEFSNAMHVVSGLLEIGRVDEARDYIQRRAPGGAIGLEEGHDFLGDGELTALLSVKAAQARELGITLELSQNADAELPLPDELRSDLLTVLGNLVDNAIEACGIGDRIRVSVTRTRASIRIDIEDSGPGVPDGLGDRIFAEGVSSKTAQTGMGRGIGLALVRRIVERRRGRITVGDSRLGGARFQLYLPVRSRSAVPVRR